MLATETRNTTRDTPSHACTFSTVHPFRNVTVPASRPMLHESRDQLIQVFPRLQAKLAHLGQRATGPAAASSPFGKDLRINE